ncbi:MULTISPECIES: MarR family winged helix-turn-helix transcriptional regulator [Prauserella salsuginis group]|uniref:DNA-binding MarR family transcriptional regulator n=2 Tax=Prauserella salsuginis group TaxID=2893672 RepID=A0A839XIY3_9PSEU|nr:MULTISPECIES: MarR family transcriptional regulator [Prauserella salsuginis group]MBB3662487.1 DNA-binding MarR family transcriptional regulator [Prauserella sediminis]MCR3720196.1 DNA-binding transcriptional regulator, MarR family [Prauserella flava]MCR3734095.1 DNA-binding transcriptional regulator, MarR family [Prauserella salsuginis]
MAVDADPGETRWLTEKEMTAWRPYIVSTLRLRQRLHRELVEAHDVSLIDYEVLAALSATSTGSMRMTELAALLGSTKSRLSHQIGRMERAGHIRRGKDPDDKRGVTAELTDAGVALLRTAAPKHVAGVRAHMIDLLTEDEQAALGSAFTRVLGHLEQLDE